MADEVKRQCTCSWLFRRETTGHQIGCPAIVHAFSELSKSDDAEFVEAHKRFVAALAANRNTMTYEMLREYGVAVVKERTRVENIVADINDKYQFRIKTLRHRHDAIVEILSFLRPLFQQGDWKKPPEKFNEQL